MKTYELIAPCHFGMESVLKQEIYDLGYEITEVSDGRVSFTGDAEAIARANIFLRTAERVLLKVAQFRATTYNELFEGTYAAPWEEYFPKDAKFWVTKASTVKSTLFSPSDIQSIMKKAMVERLRAKYRVDTFPEGGAPYPIRVFLYKDTVTAAIDTTGDSLHKRGYRKLSVKAPIAENLAAGIIMLTPWNASRVLVDPFCGSGTIPIEAALMAANIAPGMYRSFTAMQWPNLVERTFFDDCIEEAGDLIDLSVETDIQGYDIDPDAIYVARENAKAAGVSDLIHFQVRPVSALSHPKKYGFIITNPPYGQRISSFTPGSNAPQSIAQRKAEAAAAKSTASTSGTAGTSTGTPGHPVRTSSRLGQNVVQEGASSEEIAALYRTLGERFSALDSWSLYAITSYEDCERQIGRKAQKNRKIYNGMLKTYLYQFPGPKPVHKHS